MRKNYYGKKKHRRHKKKEREFTGLRVEVWNNNVEFALKKLKKKVKDSNLMLELKKRSYYEKPSKTRREKKNLQKLRFQYKNIKENNK